MHLYARVCEYVCLNQWEHTEDAMMKIDLLSNENPLQPSSERQSKGEERESEVMK